MPVFAELEITIGRRIDEKTGYPVVLRLYAIKSDQDQRFPESGAAVVNISLAELQNLRGEYAKYDAKLSETFFADRVIQSAFDTARATVNAAGAMLRVRLFLDAGAEELHAVRWECLRDPAGKALFNNDTILFSRYLASSEVRPVSGKTDPKALIAIANPPLKGSIDPEDHSKELPPVDVDNEHLRAESGLHAAGFADVVTLAAPPFGKVPATCANILDELAKGYDVLYLVCHGGLVPQDGKLTPMLWLEDGDEPIQASRLVEGIRALQKQPRLVVLASCQSAGAEGKSSSGTLGALGPLLAAAGVPAVIAMQGNVRMSTVKKFFPEFFKQLAKDGQIDRAMGAARLRITGDPDAPDCDDYWMPTLFMRLRSGRIWYQPGIGSPDGSASTDLDKWKIIRSALESPDCECTPIIGPGALEGLIGSWRDLARRLSEAYGFPMPSYAHEDLPAVSQYISVNQDRAVFAKTDLAKRIAAALVQRFPSPAMAALDPKDLAAVPRIFSEAARQLRKQNPLDPHRLLAARPFALYISANADDSMEDALREAGRTPFSDFSRWNSDPDFDLLNFRKYPALPDGYRPTVDQPLVYHLFGKLQLPQGSAEADANHVTVSREVAGCGSCVVTEDDYFNYLLSIGSKADTKELTPLPVRRALAAHALLFFGFRLDDWSFRVLLRSIFNKEGNLARSVGSNSYPCIGAQVQPDEERIEQPVRAARYYEQYFQGSKIDTFWGSVEEFARAMDKAIPAVDKYAQAIEKSLA